MKETNLQKEELLTVLSEIYDQLQELDYALEKHFSDFRTDWIRKKEKELNDFEQALLKMEINYYKNCNDAGLRGGEQRRKRTLLKLKPSY